MNCWFPASTDRGISLLAGQEAVPTSSGTESKKVEEIEDDDAAPRADYVDVDPWLKSQSRHKWRMSGISCRFDAQIRLAALIA